MSKKQGLSFYHKKKRISGTVMREISEWIFLIFTAVLIATVLVFSVGMRTSVIGVSMEPGLYNGQEILINHFLYSIVSPKRGDVIVFLPNGNQNTHYYVKRVVGLPGETIQIKDERLYIDGVLAEEEETFDKMAEAGIAENGITLGSDEYFVLGDNRNNSEDSRFANIGNVKEDYIIGRVWFIISPGEKIGLIK